MTITHDEFIEEVNEITRPRTVEEKTRESFAESKNDANNNTSEGGRE